MNISVHHTIKTPEKMQAGLHAFQPGQYEHDDLILTPYTCLQRGWLNRVNKEPLMYNSQLFKHSTSYTDSENQRMAQSITDHYTD